MRALVIVDDILHPYTGKTMAARQLQEYQDARCERCEVQGQHLLLRLGPNLYAGLYSRAFLAEGTAVLFGTA